MAKERDGTDFFHSQSWVPWALISLMSAVSFIGTWYLSHPQDTSISIVGYCNILAL